MKLATCWTSPATEIKPTGAMGSGSEAWAECAAVDAGFRSTDSDFGDTAYHCTDSELEQYQFSVSLLGEVCKTWGDMACQTVAPIGAGG